MLGVRFCTSQIIRAARPIVAIRANANISSMINTVPGSHSMMMNSTGCSSVVNRRSFATHHEETPEEFDQRFLDFFNQKDIDGWLIRKGMTELQHHDVIPEPKIVSSALRACRHVNDIALAIRFLEVIKFKCGPKAKDIYPYIIQEIRPTLDELGISTPEELGYDKPELFQPSVDWWEWDLVEEHKSSGLKKRLAAESSGTHQHISAGHH